MSSTLWSETNSTVVFLVWSFLILFPEVSINVENESFWLLFESSVINSKYYAQSRQTGQDFRSAAPPDCRIELCQDDDDDYYDDDEIKKVWMLIETF